MNEQTSIFSHKKLRDFDWMDHDPEPDDSFIGWEHLTDEEIHEYLNHSGLQPSDFMK